MAPAPPGAIATVVGAVTLPVELNVTVPPAANGPFKVTVQTAVAPGPRDAGLHASPVRRVVKIVLAVPPVVLVTIGFAKGDEVITPESPIGADGAPAASVNATRVMTPFAIALAFIPLTTQRYPVVMVSQLRLFPAAVNAGPPVTTKLLTEAAG